MLKKVVYYKRLGKYTPSIFTAIVVVVVIISLSMFLILSSTICITPIHSAYGQNSSNPNKDNTPGLDNTTNITISSKPYPIKYGITNGKVLSIIVDQSNSKISASI